MFLNKLKAVALAAAATGFVLTSAAVLGRQQAPSPGPAGGAGGVSKRFEPEKKAIASPFDEPPGPIAVGRGGVVDASRGARGQDGLPTDARSLAILKSLEQPIDMNFAAETPLEDVLKYIKQSTITPTYAGIPIYVDPAGLQEAERSMQSTVQMQLEGVPLRRTLQLVLAQLGLAYFVDDGVLVITSQDSDYQNMLPPSIAIPSPVLLMQTKAERGEMSVAEMKEFLELLKTRMLVRAMANPESVHLPARQQPAAAPPAADQTAELVKELRELIKILKNEKAASATSERKPQIQ